MRRAIAIAIAYLIGFLATYGHAYHNIGDSSWAGPNRAIGALIIAPFWPLYLAVEAFAPQPAATSKCDR